MGFFQRMFGGGGGGSDQYKGRPIGRVLTKMGFVTQQHVVDALTEQKSGGGRLGEILVRKGYVTPETGQRGVEYTTGRVGVGPAVFEN
jgi:hypothetical protein